jgi:hypothetical protein
LLLLITLAEQEREKVFNPPPIQIKATMEEKADNKVMATTYAKAGWGWNGEQAKCLVKLWTLESRFDHLAKNSRGSSAYGIAQMLKEKSKEPAIQILRGLRYIEHRYDNPCRAYRAHLSKGWY